MLISDMFGFLRPTQCIPEWRRSYARICQFQRRLFGLTSLPFLSYEATLLYQLAIDSGLVQRLPESAPQCCRLRRLKKHNRASDRHAASYAAAFGVMLAGIKLQDDVADSGRWYNRFLLWKYRRQIDSATELLEHYSPGFISSVETVTSNHAKLESDELKTTIEEYSTPTGEGFSVAYRRFSEVIAPDADQTVHLKFQEIGRAIGKAIIAWDCAVDFDQDRIRGEFNPLCNHQEVQYSFDYCLLQLSNIGWQVPSNSACYNVFANVAERVRRRRSVKAEASAARRLERWGLIREQGFAYARCDGCDALCAVGECCECLGGAGEAAAGCGDCGPGCAGCPCDGCFICAEGSNGCKAGQKKNSNAPDNIISDAENSPYAKYNGSTGLAESNLNPSGYAIFGETKVPARSRTGEFLAAGSSIKVVHTDIFGVHVTVANCWPLPHDE